MKLIWPNAGALIARHTTNAQRLKTSVFFAAAALAFARIKIMVASVRVVSFTGTTS